MPKETEIARKISNDLEKNWLPELEDYDLKRIFNEVYTLNQPIAVCNTIVCYIIFAYSPDSLWLDIKKDRIDAKTRILLNLNADIKVTIYEEVLANRNDLVNMSIFNFLETLKNWKWKAVYEFLEYSSKMFRFASQETESERSFDKMNKEGQVQTLTQEVDIDVIAKVNREKAFLLDQALTKRKQADTLIEEIAKDFLGTDTATQADFGFSFVDTSKKKDILSWRDFIRDVNSKKKTPI